MGGGCAAAFFEFDFHVSLLIQLQKGEFTMMPTTPVNAYPVFYDKLSAENFFALFELIPRRYASAVQIFPDSYMNIEGVS